MNLSPTWVPFFIQHGFEAAHWSTVGHPYAPDSVVLQHAASHDFVLFTHDLDFGMLLAAGRAVSPSVIQLRTQDVLPEAIGTVLLHAIEFCRKNLEEGAIVSEDAARNRIRLLPLA